MHASAMPRIRLARRRQTPALSARNEVHWPRPRNFQARNGDQGEAQSLPPVLRRRSNARSRLKFPWAVVEPSAPTAFSPTEFCIGFATQKLLMRYQEFSLATASAATRGECREPQLRARRNNGEGERQRGEDVCLS
jgi:hypothetical protein